jgi:hypothetical protein
VLASTINFLNLYCVNRNNNKLLPVMLTVLTVSATSTVLSENYSKAYNTSFNQNESLSHVFKLTDRNGKISYCSSIAEEYSDIEKITIAPPPPDDYIDDTRQRHNKLKKVAAELAESREKREAMREEKEKKRLQRLALTNQSSPPVIYQRNIYPGYPYRLIKKHPHGAHYQTKKPVNLPDKTHRSSQLTLPSSSFSSTFRR